VYAVDRGNPVALYEQIRRILQARILKGELGPGDRLPTEREICERYAVSRITAVRALTDLERDGLVERIQGKGTIVAGGKLRRGFIEVIGFTQSVQREGRTTRSAILAADSAAPDAALLEAFGLTAEPDERWFRFDRLRFVDEVPAVLATSYVRGAVGEAMRGEALEHASFYDLFAHLAGRPVGRDEQLMQPIVADRATARRLGVAEGSPHFCFTGATFLEGGELIELSRSIFRSDLFEVRSVMRRGGAL
jgi:GntR family transcriptional regulator